MIYVHSMDRAVRYYPERPALNVGEGHLTFRQLDHRVASLAAAPRRVSGTSSVITRQCSSSPIR
jgi:hypothetical protein